MQGQLLLRSQSCNPELPAVDAWGPAEADTLFCFPAAGCTVEIHGNISQLVCPECGAVTPMNVTFIRQLRAQKPIPCTKCSCQAIRCRVMLYGDADGERLPFPYLLEQEPWPSSASLCYS